MKPPNPVYMGLDVGDVRIGAALSRSGLIAEPFGTIERTSKRQALDELERLAREEKVTVCVVGIPFMESGEEGEQARKAKAFALSLRGRLPGVWFEYWDERYTTGDARAILGKRSGQKGLADQVAAALILQGYLDHRANQPPTSAQKDSTQ